MERKRRKLTLKLGYDLENGGLTFAAKDGDFEDHLLCLRHLPREGDLPVLDFGEIDRK